MIQAFALLCTSGHAEYEHIVTTLSGHCPLFSMCYFYKERGFIVIPPNLLRRHLDHIHPPIILS